MQPGGSGGAARPRREHNERNTDDCDVYVCPSPLHVGLVYDKFTNGVKCAGQNCNFKGCGAFTGEMAADQMKAMEAVATGEVAVVVVTEAEGRRRALVETLVRSMWLTLAAASFASR